MKKSRQLKLIGHFAKQAILGEITPLNGVMVIDMLIRHPEMFWTPEGGIPGYEEEKEKKNGIR